MGNQTTLLPEKEPKVFTELSLEKAEKIAAEVKRKVEALCDRIEIVGSIRRRKPKVHDVDFVVLTPSDAAWHRIVDIMKGAKAKINSAGNAVIKGLSSFEKSYFKVDFYRATPSTYGIHKLIRTGSAEHNIWLATYAMSKGFRLKYSEGLLKDGKVVAGETEESVLEL
jgi:DNA polymerase/3'-5' exonuclease PolX